ncbi:hypothetical protein D3C85_488070 [compost metagenome]
MSEIKTTVVSYEQADDIDFEAPSNFYIINALQEFVYLHTRDRAKAVEWVKEHYDGKYAIKVTKDQKTKSKLDGGGYSAVGSSTRRGQRK